MNPTEFGLDVEDYLIGKCVQALAMLVSSFDHEFMVLIGFSALDALLYNFLFQIFNMCNS